MFTFWMVVCSMFGETAYNFTLESTLIVQLDLCAEETGSRCPRGWG